jgi:hypothetical protein
VELGFPPFLAPLLLNLSKRNWPTTAPFCPFFVAMAFFIEMYTIHIKMTQIGSVGGEI